ncbi:MAG: hypothetical protein WCT40_03090 [Candidatus Magasanikbacteria bacterium]
MPRKKSEFLSAWGKAFEIFKCLVDAVLTAGGSDEDIARIQTNKALLAQLVATVMKYSKVAVEPVAAVAVATKKSFTELLAACRQYCVNNDFIEPSWPLEPVAADEREWEVVEHHFDKTVKLKYGLAMLKDLAMKGEIRLLVGSRRAMEWIADHPDAQLDHPVIIPLAAQNSDGSLVVPIFARHWDDGQQRDLHLCYLDHDASPVYAWLVLRKRPSVAR